MHDSTYQFAASQALFERAKRVIPAGSQGTRLPPWPDYPTYFDRAKGCRMWDVDGNEFIDFCCSIGPIILGYAYDRVDDAVRQVMADSFQCSMNTPHAIELGELLAEVVPSCDKSRFFKTGSEATHAAVRLARSITGKDKVARSGYHGWFDMWWKAGMPGVHAGTCAPIIEWDQTIDELEKTLNADPDGFAAVTICPSEVRPFCRSTFQAVIDLAHQYEALAIFDEVKTGFRTRLGGVQQLFDVCPDITTLSKGIANGYPMAAVCGRAEVMDTIATNPTAGTFNVEAIGIVAAIETIRELQDTNAPDHFDRMGRRLIDGFNLAAADRGVALHAYVEPVPAMPGIGSNDHNKERGEKLRIGFFKEAIRRGVFFSDWHEMQFINLSHHERDVDEALDVCDAAMKAAAQIV